MLSIDLVWHAKNFLKELFSEVRSLAKAVNFALAVPDRLHLYLHSSSPRHGDSSRTQAQVTKVKTTGLA